MIFLVETGKEEASLVAILRYLARNGARPVRVATRSRAPDRALHRITIVLADGAALEPLLQGLNALSGVARAEMLANGEGEG